MNDSCAFVENDVDVVSRQFEQRVCFKFMIHVEHYNKTIQLEEIIKYISRMIS